MMRSKANTCIYYNQFGIFNIMMLFLILRRDLAENWKLDVASELEEYLSELEKITFTFDNGSTTLNFAEGNIN